MEACEDAISMTLVLVLQATESAREWPLRGAPRFLPPVSSSTSASSAAAQSSAASTTPKEPTRELFLDNLVPLANSVGRHQCTLLLLDYLLQVTR